MRSGKIRADNDSLIETFVNDSKYVISESGKIYRNGVELGRSDKEGYIEIYYKGKRLKAHRIVYRKYKGTLESDLVIEHKNGIADDNSPSNLILITQRENCEYRIRREERKKRG